MISQYLTGTFSALALLIISLLLGHCSFGQQQEEELKHHQVYFIIGHIHIPNSELESDGSEILLIPGWGFGYEYHFTRKVGLGLKAEMEVSNYALRTDEQTTIIRENPMGVILAFLYKPWKELEIFAGPGIEHDENETLRIFRIGASYELEISNNWVAIPEIALVQKEIHTSGFFFGFGMGKNF